METKTVTQVIAELEAWDEEHDPYDRMGNIQTYQYENLPEGHHVIRPLNNGKQLFELQPHALGQLCQRLKVPVELVKRLHRGINTTMLNYLILNEGSDRDVMLRCMDRKDIGKGWETSKVRAVMSRSYQPYDYLPFLKAAEPYLADGLVRWYFKDEMTLHMSVSFPATATEIKPGDVVERGLHVSDSEVGVRSVTIAGYCWICKCRNGQNTMGGGDAYRIRHVGDQERMVELVRSAIESTYAETQGLVARFRESVNRLCESPFELLENIAREREINVKDELPLILNEYLSTPDEDKFIPGTNQTNLYGPAMAVSAVARQLEGERRYLLEGISTDILPR